MHTLLPQAGDQGELETRTWAPVEERRAARGKREEEKGAHPSRSGTLCTFVYIQGGLIGKKQLHCGAGLFGSLSRQNRQKGLLSGESDK